LTVKAAAADDDDADDAVVFVGEAAVGNLAGSACRLADDLTLAPSPSTSPSPPLPLPVTLLA
jgi:hypothetical protein